MILIVTGPTASGKSELGLSLASSLDGEIINIDSVQLYAGCVIGAASPNTDDLKRAPHHLYGVLSPSESYDAARYRAAAVEMIDSVRGRARLPIFVGGTSMYITALLYGLADLPKADPGLRASLESATNSELAAMLRTVDEESARSLHPSDRLRMIRAIEASSGKPASELRSSHGNKAPLLDAIIVSPTWDRETLYRRINARTGKMIREGLIDETQALLREHGANAPPLRSIGYAETVSYLARGGSLSLLEEEISKNTRRFAKRQMTWLRNQPVKRGWRARPAGDEPSVDLGSAVAPGKQARRMKHFSAWNIAMEPFLDQLRKSFRTPGIEIMFVSARAIFGPPAEP